MLPSQPNLSNSLADCRAFLKANKAFTVSSDKTSLQSLISSNIGVNSFNLLAKLQYSFLTVHLYSEIDAISPTTSIRLCNSTPLSSSMDSQISRTLAQRSFMDNYLQLNFSEVGEKGFRRIHEREFSWARREIHWKNLTEAVWWRA